MFAHQGFPIHWMDVALPAGPRRRRGSSCSRGSCAAGRCCRSTIRSSRRRSRMTPTEPHWMSPPCRRASWTTRTSRTSTATSTSARSSAFGAGARWSWWPSAFLRCGGCSACSTARRPRNDPERVAARDCRRPGRAAVRRRGLQTNEPGGPEEVPRRTEAKTLDGYGWVDQSGGRRAHADRRGEEAAAEARTAGRGRSSADPRTARTRRDGRIVRRTTSAPDSADQSSPAHRPRREPHGHAASAGEASAGGL